MSFEQYLSEAKEILDSYTNNRFDSELRLHQVLFNEQSQRSCAVAKMGECNLNLTHSHYGGWFRQKEMTSRDKYHCVEDKRYRQCIFPSIHYSIHEGALFPLNFLNEFIEQEIQDERQLAEKR